MEKKNKILIIWIFILVIMLLGISGYLIYDKVLDNNDIDINNTLNNYENSTQSEVNETLENEISYKTLLNNILGEYCDRDIVNDVCEGISFSLTENNILISKYASSAVIDGNIELVEKYDDNTYLVIFKTTYNDEDNNIVLDKMYSLKLNTIDENTLTISNFYSLDDYVKPYGDETLKFMKK